MFHSNNRPSEEELLERYRLDQIRKTELRQLKEELLLRRQAKEKRNHAIFVVRTLEPGHVSKEYMKQSETLRGTAFQSHNEQLRRDRKRKKKKEYLRNKKVKSAIME